MVSDGLLSIRQDNLLFTQLAVIYQHILGSNFLRSIAFIPHQNHLRLAVNGNRIDGFNVGDVLQIR